MRGRREKIWEDWTWGERRMRWRLEEIARREERKGEKVWIGYGRIRIGEQWWKWDEEEVLKDGRGKVREEGREKAEREERRGEVERQKGEGGQRREEGKGGGKERDMKGGILECGRARE